MDLFAKGADATLFLHLGKLYVDKHWDRWQNESAGSLCMEVA